MVDTVKAKLKRRGGRVRNRLAKVNKGRPRLSVFRSSKNISVQIIDDVNGQTIAAASSLEGDVRGAIDTGSNVAAATHVGKLAAERAIKAGVKDVVFDRGGYMYHGRVKAVAEAAREAGLNF
ncbi:MAG: 50S ribosomal protein L18 [Pseudomonadota bacterium]